MYKGTPDKNPGVSSPKNDETMKTPGQGSGPAQMQKPGVQSGQQRESGPVYSKSQGGRESVPGNENPGKMSRDGPGSGPHSLDCPGSGSQNKAGGHGGRIQGQEQMSQAPVGHESGPSGCGCPCMKNSGRQQGTDNGPSGKSDREFSDKSRWTPEDSGNSQYESPVKASGRQQMGQGPTGHESGPNGGGCPCMKNSDNQQGPENGPAGKSDREFSDKSRWAPEESGNGPRGGAIGQDRSYQGPANKDNEAFHHRFTNAGHHERSGCTDREGSGEKEVYLLVTEKC